MKHNNLTAEIASLKSRRDAVILAHNYQRREIQEIADHLGDSLELAIIASRCDQKMIVFCGVRFMAESAKILNPSKTVLLPEPEAGCPLADCATVDQVLRYRQEYPRALFVAYINTSAAVKAHCDICVTSANAVRIISRFPDREIVYLPDKNLAAYAESILNRPLIKWPGQCYVHDHLLSLEKMSRLKEKHPGAMVMTHPEAPMDILNISDLVAGTSGMLKAVSLGKNREYIIGTEIGLVDRMQRENPDKIFHPVAEAVCSQMKLTTLQSVADALREGKTEIHVPESDAVPAKRALDRMLEMS
ncbi:quinolinate synthase NadA [bacterium]|nr:quinolinate synthase NadA [candidate division CSSED10-310 bacterium]